MRVFYAADTKPNAALGYSDIWHLNLFLPLVDLGHDVVPFDYDLNPHFVHADFTVAANREFMAAQRPRLERELLSQVSAAHRRAPIDLFFSYFYSAFVSREVILEIREMGITTVNWYCNASYQFHLVEEIAPAFDFCLVPEKYRLSDYRQVGARPIHCPMAANPTFYHPADVEVGLDVLFVGAAYGNRSDYVQHLLTHGVDVHVFGPGWQSLCPPSGRLDAVRWRAGRWRRTFAHPGSRRSATLPRENCGPMLSDQKMVEAYSQTKISLGFSDVDLQSAGKEVLKQVRLRDFEAPMCGSFYMVEYMEELEDLYEVGQEIVCYESREELAEKAKYYLCHDTERLAIRDAGYRRAVRDHSWQRRLSDAFSEMGLAQ